jgi:hypothetical protein
MSRANESQSVALLPDVDQGLARRLKELGVLKIERIKRGQATFLK